MSSSFIARAAAPLGLGLCLCLTACGGGEATDVPVAAAATAQPSATAQGGVVAADQVPSVESSAAGLPTDLQLQQQDATSRTSAGA